MWNAVALASAIVLLLGCGSFSHRAAVESHFVELGVANNRAECLADDLDDRLQREDLHDVSIFLADLDQANSAGGVLDALLRIDNPRVVAAIPLANIMCMLSGGNS